MVNGPIVVREVNIDDLKHVSAATLVVNQAYRCEGGWTTEKEIVSGLRCTEQDMAYYMTHHGQPDILFFAFENTDIVGTIKIQPVKDTNEAEIGLFAVSPFHQSRGIGGQLIRNSLLTMAKLGFETAVIQVLENRPDIIAWYRKLGFENLLGERIPFGWPEKSLVHDLHVLILRKKLNLK
ncbi:hypothetical protein INT47_007784 [Mucor saturninus]|uniref:N-acetyltransferase domain-containing protein n=1 Tax=Mucor saturninus TaxID=64648 RepID=A0A8H7V670_9FUNG|nr:hypothetical protein INT47_007784 [Mucor saturninus]